MTTERSVVSGNNGQSLGLTPGGRFYRRNLLELVVDLRRRVHTIRPLNTDDFVPRPSARGARNHQRGRRQLFRSWRGVETGGALSS